MPIRLAQARLVPLDSYVPLRISAFIRAFEPFGRPDTLQMAGAGGLIREEMLKLQHSPGII
jgi:hypothetical protein